MIISEGIQSENDKTGILRLMKKVFEGFDVSDPAYFDWQYMNSPQGKALVLLAKDEDRDNSIVGVEALVPTNMIIDGKTIRASFSCNSAIDPDYRRMHLFSKLLDFMPEEALDKKINFFYGVPNEKSYNAFLKKGSLEITRLPLLVRPLKISEYFHGNLGKILFPFNNLWGIKKYDDSDILEFNDEYNTDFDNLVEKASTRVRIIQKRDRQFLKWRYSEHPTRKYRTFILKENSVLRGYVITRSTEIGGKSIGVIVDFLVDGEYKNIKKLKNLVGIALQSLWNDGSSLAIATCGHGLLEGKILRDMGFFTIPEFLKPHPLYLIIRIFEVKNQDLNKLKIFKNWFFSYGDYDVF